MSPSRLCSLTPIVIFIVFSMSCQATLKGKHRIARFETGNERVIEILADNFSDNGQGFYYQIIVSRKLVLGPSLLWFGDEDLEGRILRF